MKQVVFIAWQAATRSQNLAQILKTPLVDGKLSTNKFIRLFQYKFLMLFTLFYLCHKTPQVVFVQLPPFYALLPCLIYKALFKRKLICDCHSGIFLPKNFYQKIYFMVCRKLLARTTLIIIHNEDILDLIPELTSKVFVLEDPIVYQPAPKVNNPRLKVVIISGGGKDEPIDELLKAASQLTSIDFYLTGRHDRRKIKQPPGNFFVTGYLPQSKYKALLLSADLIIALSTRDRTVLCGAYEAVALTKPLVTSNTPTLKKYFPKGAVFTENNYLAIAQAIIDVQKHLSQLKEKMAELRAIKLKQWNERFSLLQKIISD
ncbi:MAG: glycosyltransferase [candidate division WOR-3 bacterium]